MQLGIGLGLNRLGGRAPGGVEATGGTVTEVGGFKIHTFTTSDDFVVTRGGTVDVFLVGGGGGGSGGVSGNNLRGGGAGGYVRSYFGVNAAAGTIPVVVGSGGASLPVSFPNNGNDGGYSRFGSDSTYQADGGEGARSDQGADGGSGGGGGGEATFAGNGGSDGANGSNGDTISGGSGQGFSTREYNQRFNASTSQWETIDVSSTATLYGGGGGGASTGTLGTGGAGGGGDGANPGPGENGVNGLGGGGGGSRAGGISSSSGGDGIVIIRYPA